MKSRKFYQSVSPTLWKINISIFCLVASLFSTSGGSAQENKIAKRNPLSQENAQRGMDQYNQTCVVCHGAEAKGATGPNLIGSSLVRHDEKGNLIADVVRNGRLSKGMPSFSDLTERQINDLVAFLHAEVEAADNRASASGPARGLAAGKILVGDVEAGRKFFSGVGGCASCHSPTGDLKGVAKKYSALELEGRLLYPEMEYQTATVTLSTGESFKGKVLHQDQFYVSLLDESGDYRSWELKRGVKVVVDDPLHAHRKLLDRYKDKEIHDVFAYLESLQ
jgi:cytochrome c oxidase cbb3-type subunit 3